jgi:hypothetical protein
MMQMQTDRLGHRLKNADNKIKKNHEADLVNNMLVMKLIIRIILKKTDDGVGMIYE